MSMYSIKHQITFIKVIISVLVALSLATSLVDLIQHQNQLTMKLLNKQNSMTSAIDEIKHDLKETQSHVDQLVEAQQKKPQTP